jgi:uncharacterized protein (DUF2164 family)
MPIELSKESRAAAIASIERYCEEEFDENIGNMRAAALLNFFLKEVGPSVYNSAVRDVQERLMARVSEIDLECHEDEFTFWQDKTRAGKR